MEIAVQTILHKNAEQTDRLMAILVCFLFLVSFGFAFLYSTWLVFALCAPALTVAGVMAWRLRGGTVTSRLVFAFVFMAFAGLMIDQAHGMIETHFGIFALLAFLLAYRDWRPIVMAAGVIAVHHLLFCQLQMAGYPVWVLPHAHSYVIVLIHAAYVVAESAILIHLAQTQFAQQVESAHLATLASRTSADGSISLAADGLENSGETGRAVAEFLGSIAAAVANTAQTASDINAISTSIDEASQQLSSMSSQQSECSEQAHRLMDQVRSVTESVAQASNQTVTDVREAVGRASQSLGRMQQGLVAMADMEQAMQVTARQTTEMYRVAESIVNIVSGIEDIAGQTNLLALNASIEAARAGEAGRGFAVVANEVRRLSEMTTHAVTEVQNFVGTLRSAVKGAADAVEASQSTAERGQSEIKKAAGDFSAMCDDLNELARRIQGLESEMAQQVALTKGATGAVERTAAIVSEGAASIHAVAQTAHRLRNTAGELAGAVGRFHAE